MRLLRRKKKTSKREHQLQKPKQKRQTGVCLKYFILRVTTSTYGDRIVKVAECTLLSQIPPPPWNHKKNGSRKCHEYISILNNFICILLYIKKEKKIPADVTCIHKKSTTNPRTVTIPDRRTILYVSRTSLILSEKHGLLLLH